MKKLLGHGLAGRPEQWRRDGGPGQEGAITPGRQRERAPNEGGCSQERGRQL
jgi:hypothetical protein